jgi:hypothetical protein
VGCTTGEAASDLERYPRQFFSFMGSGTYLQRDSLYGQQKTRRRLERAGQEGLGYPPRAAWSLAVFGMKGLKRVRGG